MGGVKVIPITSAYRDGWERIRWGGDGDGEVWVVDRKKDCCEGGECSDCGCGEDE